MSGRSAAEPFEVFDAAFPFAGARYGPMKARMAVVGLRDGGVVVVSPGAPLTDAWVQEIAAFGPVRFLLAPNHFHNAGIAGFKARYPDAVVVAHPRAIPRLSRKVPGVRFEGLEALERALPEGAHLLCPPMAKQGEVWLSLPTARGRAWFVTDSIVNERRLPGGPFGLFMKLQGWRTGVIVNPFFKRLFVSKKKDLIVWAREQLVREQPVVFVPAHGAACFGEDVPAQISAALDAA